MKQEDNHQLYFTLQRIMDVTLAICFLFFLAPLYVIVGFAIWLQDWHSPIYYHERIGWHARPFNFYKFRSMVSNADLILQTNAELYKQLRSGNNKIKDDPRITKLGKFIRKYSIDELPQMVNVLKGEMSFVGPRALRPDERQLYKEKSSENAAKLDIVSTVRPGITGFWQISGRSNIDFDKRIDMDVYYAQKKSIWYDIMIILKTPLAVLEARGSEGY